MSTYCTLKHCLALQYPVFTAAAFCKMSKRSRRKINSRAAAELKGMHASRPRAAKSVAAIEPETGNFAALIYCNATGTTEWIWWIVVVAPQEMG